MKSLFFNISTVLILTFSTTSNAQFIGTDPVFTASIYGNAADITFTSDAAQTVVDYNSEFGYGIKVGYTETIQEGLKASLDIGLLKGAWSADDPNSNEKFEFDALYFTIEPTIQKSFNGILARGGVFLDYGLGGTNTLPSGNEFKIFKDEALNRTNAGIVIGTGIDITEATRSFAEKWYDANENYFFEFNINYRRGLIDVEGRDDANNQKAILSYFTFGIKGNLTK